MVLAALALAVSTAAGIAATQVAIAPPARIAIAVRANGELSDDFWNAIPATGGFLQREPEEGGTPSQRTEFRVAYDATTLFVKVHAFDTDTSHIVSYLTRRDGDSPSDWIRILLDSYHDKRTAYEFAVNPAGVKSDRYWYNDTNSDDSWDAVWDVKVSRDPDGWSAEFRIPFSQVRFTPSDALTFGFAVTRQIGRLNQTITWPLLARSATGYVSSFGDLRGLSMGGSPKRLEAVPYTVVNLTRQRPEGNPLLSPSAGEMAIGLDVKYAVTPGLTLTATVNPDFGQVEADPAVVNLSAFETFFAERRPFFVEGSGNFNFDADCWDGPCSMFYSRRVGRAPHGTDNLPDGDTVYTSYPTQSTILGAAKLTGRVGKFSVGAMYAVTQEETAEIVDGPVHSQQAVEPTTSYAIGRMRREFTNQSSIGFMVTSTNRKLPGALDFLPSSGYTGGVDFDARFRKLYSVSGFFAASRVNGAATAIESLQEDSRHYYQRPDAVSFALDPTRTSLSGSSARIGINKIGGQRLRFMSQIGFKSPGFDLNDAGFLRRADERWLLNWMQLRSDKPNAWLRSRNLNVNQYAVWNADGDLLVNGANVNGSATFVNNWQAGGGVNTNKLTVDDRMTRGGPVVLTEGFDNFWSWFNTDNRRHVSANVFLGAGRNGVGSWFAEQEISLTFRPISPLTITSGVRINRAVNDTQWTGLVTDTTDHYTFGRIDQTTVSLAQRLNYTVTPNLSLQLYAEPFVSGGDYSAFKELANGRAVDYSQRYTPYTYDIAANGDPNFNVKSFRTTNVLRWEYKPGSTLFVVWQQARENDAVPGGFQFGRDVHAIFGVPPKNVFLVKLAYWVNY
jgi:hypothetical protein